MKELAVDPALREAGSVVEVDQKGRGSFLTVGSPIKFSEFTPEITASPLLGQDTDDVLYALGYDADAVAALHAKGVV
jgi:formyl-CoA transferase